MNLFPVSDCDNLFYVSTSVEWFKCRGYEFDFVTLSYAINFHPFQMSSTYKYKWERKVKCRICKDKVTWKNYRTHLQRSHKDENCNDLSVFEERKVTSFFSVEERATSASAEDEASAEGGEPVNVEEAQPLR